MNTSTNPPDTAVAQAAGAQAKPRATPLGSWVAWLAALLAAMALLSSFWLWQRLGAAQQELARRSQTSAQESVAARRVAGEAEALVQELQARLSVAEARLSEVSLQRSQLDELMLSLSRSRDDNLVHDLESSLRLAQQQMQLIGDAQPLLMALQAADARIIRAAQPRLNPVQRAIERDIERIQSTPMADLPGLSLLLDELTRQVGDWPLIADPVALAKRPQALVPEGGLVLSAAPAADATALASDTTGLDMAAPAADAGPGADLATLPAIQDSPNPLPALSDMPAPPTRVAIGAPMAQHTELQSPSPPLQGGASAVPLANRMASQSDLAAHGTGSARTSGQSTGGSNNQAPLSGQAPLPSDASGSADGVGAQLGRGWEWVSGGWRGFWSQVWQSVTQSGRELVRVTRIEHPEAALLAPEQAVYLRENLKLQLLNAKLGVLARQWPSVQHDVLAVEQALTRYFDPQSPSVARTLRTLQGLRADLLHTELPRADESLTALAAAAGGR